MADWHIACIIRLRRSATVAHLDSGAPQPGAFFCVTGARYTFGINRWSAFQAGAAACNGCEPGYWDAVKTCHQTFVVIVIIIIISAT